MSTPINPYVLALIDSHIEHYQVPLAEIRQNFTLEQINTTNQTTDQTTNVTVTNQTTHVKDQTTNITNNTK